MPPRHHLETGADEPDIYIPTAADVDPHAEHVMEMGKVDDTDNNDLRDPWMFSQAGLGFLEQHGEL